MMMYQRSKPDALLPSSSSSPLQQQQQQQHQQHAHYSSTSEAEAADETSPLFVNTTGTGIGTTNSNNRNDNGSASSSREYFDYADFDGMMMLPSSRRKGGRHSCAKKTVMILFGLALLAGITLILSSDFDSSDGQWHTTYSYNYDSGWNENGDDDDHDYDYKYNSWTDRIMRIPLLGSSHKSKAQRHADEAKDYLYLKPKDAKHHQHKHLKDTELWGSSNTKDDLKAPDGCEGSVLIIRHCEKGDIREHCNYIGYERSVYLASLFGDNHERYPTPSYLIAETPGDRRNPKKKNFRELETLLPLGEKFKIDVDTSFSTLDMHKLTRHVHGMFREGKMCGKLMVIAWKHSKIPRVATALGCGPREGCPMDYPRDEYDKMVEVKLVYRKPLHSEHRHLKPPKHAKWNVYGSIHQQHFDPLAFSKQSGDYPKGGTSHGARWRDFDHEIPERIVFNKKKWKKLGKKDRKKWTKWYKSSS